MRRCTKFCSVMVAVAAAMGFYVSGAAADCIVAVVNSTDRSNVKVVVSKDGKAFRNLTFARDGGAISFEIKGAAKTLGLTISGAPHNGTVTVNVPPGPDYQMLLLQITENGFVNVGAPKIAALRISTQVDNKAAEAKVAKVLKAKGASTGDVEVTLHWTNPNDLDLAVIEPSGEKIWYKTKNSKSGGKLEFDANVRYDSKNTNAIEHIFWPKGKAPKGKYKIVVNHYQNHGKADCTDPTTYTVRLVIGGVPFIYQSDVSATDPRRSRSVEYGFEVK